MFFIKLFYFLKGYVIIRAEGFFIERFINICIRRDIALKKIKRTGENTISAELSFSDFKKIRPVARKARVKIKILKKCGLPNLKKRYKKRYAFFIGAFLFVLFFAVSSRFIWTVEINGADTLSKALILDVLKTEGVYTGALKCKMSEPREIKDSLMRSFNNISWAWAYVEGSKIRIEINEGTLPPMIVDNSLPCDIIAMRDGLIEKMTVTTGESRVEKGTAVMAGDLLIAGTLTKKDGSFLKTVHASGEVFARTWHEKTGTYTLTNHHRIPTGRTKACYTLDLFSKTINLGSFKNTYKDYDTYKKKHEAKIGKKYYLGLGLTVTEYCEVETVEEIIPYESAVAFAEYDLEQQIAKDLLPGAVLCDKKTTVKNIDDHTIEVTLLMEFTEKIGTQAIIYKE